jgi:hypothetical protein
VAEEEEWPPPEAHLTSALWRAEAHLERREFFAAARALEQARGLGEDEFVAALRHLAAAGYRAQTGEPERARRQLQHARRRLAPFLPETREIELQPLLAAVAVVVESAGGNPDGDTELA